MNPQYKAIITAAQRGGAMVKKYFGKEFTVTEKSAASDVCTTADLESEKVVLDVLDKNFFDFNIFSEEAGIVRQGSKNGTFYIDPLDGTNNFVLGIPYFSTAIVLVQHDVAQFAVVYDPIMDLTYWAERGGGAYLGSVKLAVSREIDIERSTAAYIGGYTVPTETMLRYVGTLARREVKRVITNWSPQMDFCALAAGRIETIVHQNDQLYDYLGGKLIAREAGAVVSDFFGKLEAKETNGEFVLSNRLEIHTQIITTINQ